MKTARSLRLMTMALAAVCVMTLVWFGASESATEYVTQVTEALQTP